MNFLSFLFRTVDHFVIPDNENEHDQMVAGARREWGEILLDEPVPENQQNWRFKALRWCKKNTQDWLSQYMLGVAHLILIKVIGDFLQASPDEEPNEEEAFKRFQAMYQSTKVKF